MIRIIPDSVGGAGSESLCGVAVDSDDGDGTGNLKEFCVTAIILTPGACVGGSRAAVDDTGLAGSGACPQRLVLPSKTPTFHKK